MPLKIVDDKCGSRPAIFCDCCGKEIRTAAEGNYHWDDLIKDERGNTPLYFSHKNEVCAFQVDRRFKTPSCVGIEGLLFFLCHNMKFDLKKAEKRERESPGGFF